MTLSILGSGGPETKLLLVAVALTWLGSAAYFVKSVKRFVSVSLIVAALFFVAASYAIGSAAPSGSGINVRVTIPRDGATVSAKEPVEVRAEVSGGQIVTTPESDEATAGHLHVYLDGELVSMPTRPTYRVKLEPGLHNVEVEFVNAQHLSYSPRVIDEVAITAK